MPDSKFLVTSVKVQINAPASLVWDVLVDLDNYPQWNPYTVKVESTLEMGEPVNLFLPDPTRPGELIHVIEHLAAFDQPKQLSWELSPSDLSPDAARRDQYIEATGDASCTYYTTDLFLGPTAPVVMEQHGPWVKQGFDAVAHSLKTRAEQLYANRATAQVAKKRA
jgi:hypothetical protein